jgi:spore coat polysaccharide biosynthesis protein SpsF
LLVIIQARSSSERFKNKVMYEIYDKPMIWWVWKSVKMSKYKNKVVIATSNNRSDNKLFKYLKKNKIKVYRGSLTNVTERLMQTAKKHNSKYFIRISGDSPLLHSSLIDNAISCYKNLKKKFDLITNIYPKRIYSKGMSVELIRTDILKQNIKNMTDLQKEHVTKYFYDNNLKYKIIPLKKNYNLKKYFYGKVSLTVDNFKDIKKIKPLIKKKFKI